MSALPAKGPAALGGRWAPTEVRAAVVGTDIPAVRQRLGGHRAVRQRHQVTERLSLGDLEWSQNSLKGGKRKRNFN